MIDRLEEHEAFLRAIFDAPDDDTPRLVYADFLEENGLPDRAELIRVQCDLARIRPGGGSAEELARLTARQEAVFVAIAWEQPPLGTDTMSIDRGFWTFHGDVAVSADRLADPVGFREWVVRRCPGWYALSRLAVLPGRPLGPDEVNALFDLPFTQQVTDWDLGGHVEEVAAGPATEDTGAFGLIDLIEQPVITVRGVEALAAHRGARRIRSLNLRHNRLDNDAARALARSPHLIRLERLELHDGQSNRFGGKTWSELVERFGEKVVG
ncbi:MAG: TIGR02996 domain-containing protein [Gemmataceae bacterium]|nr:TIGR02996 domain-containing protein [Gemmataceae bacterium]